MVGASCSTRADVACGCRKCHPGSLSRTFVAWSGATKLSHGLHAILKLHTAQEDESFLSLADDMSDARRKARVA